MVFGTSSTSNQTITIGFHWLYSGASILIVIELLHNSRIKVLLTDFPPKKSLVCCVTLAWRNTTKNLQKAGLCSKNHYYLYSSSFMLCFVMTYVCIMTEHCNKIVQSCSSNIFSHFSSPAYSFITWFFFSFPVQTLMHHVYSGLCIGGLDFISYRT